MRSNFNIFSIFIFCIGFSSCSKEIEQPFDIPSPTPFATCYLTNKSEKIKLFYKDVISINDTMDGIFPDITDALVNIHYDGITVQMIFDTIEGAYVIDTSIIPVHKGQIYQIELTRPGEKTINASCIIPDEEIPDVTFSYFLVKTPGPNVYFYNYTFYFNDTANSEKYYFARIYQRFPKANMDSIDDILKIIPIVKKKNQSNYSESNELLIYNNANQFPLQIQLFLINRDMYLYFLSVEQNKKATHSDNAIPSEIYSNFIGGKGIFGPVISK